MNLLGVIVVLIINLLPVQNLDATKEGKIYYYTDEGYFMGLPWDNPSEEASLDERVFQIIEALLNYEEECLTLIPGNTKVTNVRRVENNFEVTFSNDIMNYGGNYWEWGMVNQILATLFSLKEVQSVSLYIEKDYEPSVFVEGTIIKQYSRKEWNERKKIIWQELMEENLMTFER